MIRVGVIGANGFLGLELLRILSIHPKVEISKILKTKQIGLLADEHVGPCKGLKGMEGIVRVLRAW